MSLGTILIRADAGKEMGTGHVMRCLALAQAWQAFGGSAVFLMAQSTPAVRARLAAERCYVVCVSMLPGSLEDSSQTSEFACRYDADWVVIDGYSFGAEYHEALRRRGYRVLCLDDAGELDYYAADIVLNQNLQANQNWYHRRSSTTQVFLGPRFCLLRREFLRWRGWQRNIPASAHNALVTLGGTPSAETGIRIIHALSLVRIAGFQAVFAVGGSSSETALLERYAANSAAKITIHKDVRDMAALMASADLAISAAGSTCWELCFLGLPSVLLDIAANQVPVAQALHREGCTVYLGNAHAIGSADLARAVEEISTSQEQRRSLSSRSQQLADGLEAERVISAMRSAVGPMASTRSYGVPV